MQLDVVLLQVLDQFVSTHHFGDLDQLVIVIMSVEEWFLLEQHPSQHATQAPHVQAVVVGHIVQQQLWPFEVPARHSDIVLCVAVVELGESSVDESELSLVVVDHYVVRLDVSVDNSLAVAVIEGFQDFVHVKADIEVRQSWEELFEVDVINIFEDEAGSLALSVSHDVDQFYNIDAALQVL